MTETSKFEEPDTKVLKPSASVVTDETQIVIPSNSRRDSCSSDSSRGHKEPHFGSAEVVRDIVIGLSDGLTVPFALAAGLATLDNSRLVVTAGMAEVVAGAISMGLGGYLAGLSEIEHYDAERLREKHEVETVPEREEEEIVEIFEPFGLTKKDLAPMLNVLRNDKEAWVDFMMKFELQLERPSVFRSWISALTIGFSYFLGGLIPLIPYMVISEAMKAMELSIGVTLLALFIFGFVILFILILGKSQNFGNSKASFISRTNDDCWWSSRRMCIWNSQRYLKFVTKLAIPQPKI